MPCVIVNTDYSDMNRIDDVPGLHFQAAVNPLYVGVKDQQVERMTKRINAEKLGGNSVGFWELINKKGSLKNELLKGHDYIFIADPIRCHESFREQYSLLVDTIRGL